MNESGITAIAREYAEECIDPQGFSKSTYEELLEEKAENVAYVLRWLSQRYCFVEKSKVEEEYNKTVEEGKHSHLKHQIQSRIRMRLLAALFPDLGKEVEDA